MGKDRVPDARVPIGTRAGAISADLRRAHREDALEALNDRWGAR